MYDDAFVKKFKVLDIPFWQNLDFHHHCYLDVVALVYLSLNFKAVK